LLDENFATGLAEYAEELASRFPHLKLFTPVNEPLTTARFSALYGHWYPHKKDPLSFIRAVFIQCRATRLAMERIRKIQPEARLIQTEDMGKTHCVPGLEYQADFENERRWFSLDLLTGRVNTDHPMWSYLRWAGIEAHELDEFRENPCPPDVIGLNYYVTSERFLDAETAGYPECVVGGNHKQRYADVDAVRVSNDGAQGVYGILREAWERFHLPIAVTEAHLGCTREEQLRWLIEGWKSVNKLRSEGVPVCALTAWSLLGAYDWDSLLTLANNSYEAGAFDLRSGKPRATAVVHCLQSLAKTGEYEHSVTSTPGWWRRPVRLLYPSKSPARNHHHLKLPNDEVISGSDSRPVVILGSRGTLGAAFARLGNLRGLNLIAATRSELDLCNASAIRPALQQMNPWAVINAAGYVRVDDAEADCDTCHKINCTAPAQLAEICADLKIRLVNFSSDLVFDGRKAAPYLETDPVCPLNVYGQSKAEMERLVSRAYPDSLIIRTSAFFGPWDEYNFATILLRHLARGEKFTVPKGLAVSPSYVPDLVHASLDLLIDGESGIWHLANQGNVTWAEFGRQVAHAHGFSADLIEEVDPSQLGYIARRPAYSVLGTVRGPVMPSLERALRCYLNDRREFTSQGMTVPDCPAGIRGRSSCPE
jgi:dTDP-4-dehydrorhamnose reductase